MFAAGEKSLDLYIGLFWDLTGQNLQYLNFEVRERGEKSLKLFDGE